MTMKSLAIGRSVLAFCCGAAATMLVVTIGGAAVVNMSYSADELARIRANQPGSVDNERAMAEISHPFERVVRAAAMNSYIVFPLAAAAAGVIVGLIASRGPVVLAALSAVPLSGVLLAEGVTLRNVTLGIAYLALAGSSAWMVSAWRCSRRSAS